MLALWTLLSGWFIFNGGFESENLMNAASALDDKWVPNVAWIAGTILFLDQWLVNEINIYFRKGNIWYLILCMVKNLVP